MATQKYFKRNYIEPLKIITPEVYLQKDEELFGTQTNNIAALMNSHIRAADNISELLPLSSTDNFQNITTVSGIAPFFINQLGYGDFSPTKFQVEILSKLNKNISDFDTSADFKTYLSGTLLPSIQLGSTTLHTDTGSVFDSTLSGTHEYLLRNMDWMFLLNASAPEDGSYAPSSYVLDTIVNETYMGRSINLVDGVKGFQEYIWKNWNAFSGTGGGALLPNSYYSSTGEWTSGTQQLDKLKTLVGAIYSPEYSDSTDTYVLQSFKDYIDAGLLIEDIEAGGPFTKLLKAMSFSIADRNAEVNKLDALLDIEQCPEEYLPYLADIIGWKLIGPDVSKWRKQLRNAVTIYKAKGTRKALQVAVDSVYKNDVIQGYSTIQELWESYIPNLLYYLLLTDTGTLFTKTTLDESNFETWTREIADTCGVSDYSDNDSDTNVRFVVDHILHRTVAEYPEQFYYGGEGYPFGASSFVFKYRDRIFGIPPWETENFYRECHVSEDLLTFLQYQLKYFGVSETKAQAFFDYCKAKILEVTDDALLGGSFVFFTSSNEYPPNYDDIINNLEADKTHLLGLWNGKSSHVDLTLSAGDFDLSILEDSVADRDLFFQSLKVLDEFAPAHAILKTKLLISDNENATVSSVICSKIEKDLTASNSVSGETSIGDGGDTWNLDSNLGGGSDDGVNMSALGNIFKRADVANYGSLAFTTSGMVGVAPVPFGNEGIGRNSRRRRNYAHTLPRSGSQLYLRDGASMPIILNPSDTGKDNYLGYIPSSGRYLSASAYNNLPALYGRGENLNSPHTYYGVDVSNTYPCRGTSSLVASSCHPYSVRGETPLIWVIMNELMRAKNLQRAGKQYEINSDYYYLSSWMDVSGSLANSYNYPESIEDYENFEFGSDLHSWFTAWKNSNISLRTFVDSFIAEIPSLFNGDFSIPGSAVDVIPNLIAKKVDNTLILDGDSIFREGITASGTQVLTSSTDTLFMTEFENKSILSGMSFYAPSSYVHPNDESILYKPGNITLYNLSAVPAGHSEYLLNKPIVLMRPFMFSESGPPPDYPEVSTIHRSRITFSLSDAGSEGLNSLYPNCKYKLRIKFACVGATEIPGVAVFGLRSFITQQATAAAQKIMWYSRIENYLTFEDDGFLIPDYDTQLWDFIRGDGNHFNPNFETNSGDYWDAFIYDPYATPSISNTNNHYGFTNFLMTGYKYATEYGNIPTFTQIVEGDMLEAEFEFNTNNGDDYVFGGHSIHSLDTNYLFNIIPYIKSEQFYHPDPKGSIIIEQVSLENLTLGTQTNLINNYTVPNFETGEDETYTEKIDLTPNQILRIFQFWNNVSTSVLQSRIGGPGYTGPQGGSRLNYRMHPEWYNNTKGASNQYTKINIK